eukprot:9490947-Pyramimonas_sp.AAC.1
MLRLREAEFDVDKVRLSVPQLKAVLVMLTGCKPKGNKPELLKSLVEVLTSVKSASTVYTCSYN